MPFGPIIGLLDQDGTEIWQILGGLGLVHP
jgi:hypothetical protein